MQSNPDILWNRPTPMRSKLNMSLKIIKKIVDALCESMVQAQMFVRFNFKGFGEPSLMPIGFGFGPSLGTDDADDSDPPYDGEDDGDVRIPSDSELATYWDQ